MAIAEVDYVGVREDLQHLDAVVGQCEGTVLSLNVDNMNVEVNSSPMVCNGCLLSEYCSESKAD